MTKKVSPFQVILKKENKSESYRVSAELFNQIKKDVAPYRSLSEQSKPVKCIETGEIFNTARHAMRWLRTNGITTSRSADEMVRGACRGSKEAAYGYHWEYVKI